MSFDDKPHLLIADDNASLLDAFRLTYRSRFVVHAAQSVIEAKRELRQHPIDVVLVDLNFEGQEQDGVDLLRHLHAEYPRVSVIILSGDQNTARIRDASMSRHVAFVVKDHDEDELLEPALKKALAFREDQKRSRSKGPMFLTKSKTMIEVLKDVNRLIERKSNAPILILGETGTGKEVMAKYIAAGLAKKLVAVNMSAFNPGTVDSELFGHVAGAFTGAIGNRIGQIEQAHRGIFFLDELGECSLPIQASLLRVIQEKEVRPVGATAARHVDVQFIGATNRDLQAMVNAKEFREDLAMRLNTFVIRIPPLRERPEDVEFFFYHFLSDQGARDRMNIKDSALAALNEHPWTGNVRELEHMVHRLVTLWSGEAVDGDLIREVLRRGEISLQRAGSMTRRASSLGEPVTIQEGRDLAEKKAILQALTETGGNRENAARLLNISPAHLYRKLKQFGIKGIMISGRRRRKITSGGATENTGAPSPELGGMKCELA